DQLECAQGRSLLSLSDSLCALGRGPWLHPPGTALAAARLGQRRPGCASAGAGIAPALVAATLPGELARNGRLYSCISTAERIFACCGSDPRRLPVSGALLVSGTELRF